VRLLSFGIALVVVSTAFAAAAKVSDESAREADVRELERLETVWNQAHERGDADALETLWADDLEVAVPRMPVMSRTDVAAFAHSGRMKFLRYQTSELHVRVYDNAAVVTGRLQRTRVLNEREVSDDWRFTKVYVRRANKWRVVAFHASESALTRYSSAPPAAFAPAGAAPSAGAFHPAAR
jgi:ketosteroid isomerase-like protein